MQDSANVLALVRAGCQIAGGRHRQLIWRPFLTLIQESILVLHPLHLGNILQRLKRSDT